MKAKETITKIAVEISRLILGVTFIFSGFVKAVDPLGMSYKIEDYIIAFGLDPLFFLALPASIGLCVLEFALGAFMLLGIYRKWTSRLTFLVMCFMTVLTLYLAIANPVSDCGCFGDAIIITNWQTFYKNLVLLAAAIIVLIYHQKITNLFTGKFYWMVALFIILFGTGFSFYNYYTEPILEFRPYKVGANLPQLMSVEESKGDVYENVFIYEKEGVKKEFTEDNYPWQDSTWVFVDRINKLIEEGEKPAIHDFTINRLYFSPDKKEIEGEEDITREVLEDKGYVFLMIAYSLDKMGDTYLSRFEDINNYANDHRYTFYCLTASTQDEILKWENSSSNNFKFCLTDERTLKTITRSNPGLLLLKDGHIVNKWATGEVPSEVELTTTLDKLPYGTPVDTERQERGRLWTVIVAFLIPLLVIKFFDFVIYRKRLPEEEQKESKQKE